MAEATLLLLLVLASQLLRSSCLSQSQKNNHKNISELLDSLLRGYDNSLRPDFGGPPTMVEIDIMVRSMGPISEVDMSFSMDCYFRQSWVDKRLALSNYQVALALSISMLERIWKPDTHLYNGQKSYLHTITTPNKFVRLYPDGRVLYSSRLTIKASCPMNLEDFPMDTQRCPLKMGSFGYSTRDVLYMWNKDRRVNIASDMKMSQFDLIATPSANQTDVYPAGERSVLVVSFHLRRHTGYFLLQVYFPCVLLNVLSWVAFWINREATADRVALGVTTVLTMTFLGMEARMDLPKVPYPTALDFFVFLSFAFIFASIIQFALVHYFTKYGSGEVYFSTPDEHQHDLHHQEDQHSQSVAFVMEEGKVSPPLPPPPPPPTRWPPGVPVRSSRGGTFLPKRIPMSSRRQPSSPTPTSSNGGQQQHRFNSVSKIDRLSRFLFPLAFFVINLFYWFSYLTKDSL